MGGVNAPRTVRSRASKVMTAAVALAVLAASCGGEDDDGASAALGDGSLGIVKVAEGQSVQIRTLLWTAEAGSGRTNERIVRMAVADFGPVHGFEVGVESLNEDCSAAGGETAGAAIAGDPAVVGVIGTTCSVAAIAAAPLVTAAGMVMISPSNTSPVLTAASDGVPGPHSHAGYYRTANNDLHQGAAVARFLHLDRGIESAAVVHTGDAYTESLADAFVETFESLGGRITGVGRFADDQTDVADTLQDLGAGQPGGLFMSVSREVGAAVVAARGDVAGLAEIPLVANEGLIGATFMGLPETAGLYFSGPSVDFGDNTNQGTGVSAGDLLDRYRQAAGAEPDGAFWGHAYDAAVLLLEAIAAASARDGDTLRIDRAGVRQYLDTVAGYEGIIGPITCAARGDCGLQHIDILHHTDPSNFAAARDNVVYQYEP